MKTFLEKEGFEVEGFSCFQDASIAIVCGAMDMVIMGLAFSDADGETFLDKILESFNGPVIVISSSVDNRLAKKLIDLGARIAINKSGPWQEALKPHLSALNKT